MDLVDSLRIYLRVVDTASFTKAAETLHIDVPRVTRAVKSLEIHLGTRLLNRSTRHLSITESGASIIDRAKRILEEVGTLEDSASHSSQKPHGKLRVNLPLSIASGIIAPALPQFIEAYPAIQVELDTTDRHIDLVQSGVDCLIRTGVMSNLDLIAKKIGTAPAVICAAPNYLSSYGNPQHPSELADHVAVNYISSLTHKPRPWQFTKEGVELTPISMNSIVSVTDAKALEAFTIAGLGIGILPAYAAEESLKSGALVEILAGYRPYPREVFLLRAPGPNRLKVDVFTKWLTKQFDWHPSLTA